MDPSPMVTLLLLLPPAAFALLATLAVRTPGRRPQAVLRAITPLSLVALAGALAAATLMIARGTMETPTLGSGLLSVTLRLDPLSAPLMLVVTVLGAVVLRFSRHYLDGDARHGTFLGWLAVTITFALLLVTAGTLTLLLSAWMASSLALHRLLRFYADRRGAVTAARKKFVVARIADLALGGACLLLAGHFGTVHIGTLLDAAAGMSAAQGAAGPPVQLAAWLLVIAVAFKSAQFPTHGWLVDVMEAPTPVSALLHAGLLNAGPFVVLRLAPLLLLAPASRAALLAVALVTALAMALSMATQSRVKTALGYSSAAHMGFSLALSALGLFPLALLHLVAHSCYKAHAFLRSGSAVEPARQGTTLPANGPVSPTALASGIVTAIVLVAGASALAGRPVTASGALLGVAALLAIGLVPLIARAPGHGASAWLPTLLAATGVAVAFFGVEVLAERVATPWLPLAPVADRPSLALLGVAVGASALAVLLSLVGVRGAVADLRARLYLRARNGWYANARFDTLVGAYRARRPLTLATELAE